MMKKALATIALAGVAMSAQADVLLHQGFDNVSGLGAQGWVLNNASTPGGSSAGWYQGDQQIFTSQSGASNSYAGANYNNAPAGGQLDNWLITPSFDASRTVTVSFWLHADPAQGYSDQVAFGFSNGSSAIGAFTMAPVFTVPTNGWTMYSATIGSQGYGSSARFAIEYTGAADSANAIGVDTMDVSNVPEPASALLLVAGLLGLRATRRQRG